MNLLRLLTLFRFWRHLHYHRDILKHLRWSKVDSRRLDFYNSLIKPTDLVFDVGANMGNRSKIFRAIGAKVVAFEPQSYCANFLASAFSGDSGFALRQQALSDHEGIMTMHLSNAHVLSTLDTEWIDRMNNGGRFAHQWSRTEQVGVTTLDRAISTFGIPAFIKIDVEGHELSVLRGLSQAINYLSMEFASESLDKTIECVNYLALLGNYKFQISFGESMIFQQKHWLNVDEACSSLLSAKESDPLTWGDLYAKLEPHIK